MINFFNKKSISVSLGIFVAAVLILSASGIFGGAEVSAKARKHGGKSDARCSTTCPATEVTKGGVVYTYTAGAQYKCSMGWPSWGCGAVNSEAAARIGPGTLSGSFGLSCGNVHYFSVIKTRPVTPPTTPTTPTTSNPNNPGGGGSCPSGTTWCGTACLTSCGGSGTYVPTVMNTNIPATEGPVKLKTLGVTPPIGNPGYSCRIAWNDAFTSYNTDTHCTFTGTGGVSLKFDPASSTAPLYHDSGALRQESVYKMTCYQGTDTTKTETKETVCRINWNYQEVN